MSGRRRTARWTLAASLALSGMTATAPEAAAWGRLGHRASAKLTEARLTPAARAAVHDLLEPGESLADASTWADEHRREIPESAPWHYVNVPITEPKYDARFCPEQGCVVRKIAEFRKVVADRSAPRDERRKALRFLVHFVQDMHQPVHVGDRGDRGGNDLQVRFFGEGSNLHRVWDSGLVERAFHDEAALTAALARRADEGDAGSWAGGSVEDWADESLAAARRAYRLPGSGRGLKPGDALGDAYQAESLPVAERRLAQAGVRLAAVLNAAFPPNP